MKHRVHFSFAGLLAGFAAYRELWQELPGTGQSVMDLLHTGYTRTELSTYFPSATPFIDLAVLLLAIIIAGHGLHQRRRHT